MDDAERVEIAGAARLLVSFPQFQTILKHLKAFKRLLEPFLRPRGTLGARATSPEFDARDGLGWCASLSWRAPGLKTWGKHEKTIIENILFFLKIIRFSTFFSVFATLSSRPVLSGLLFLVFHGRLRAMHRGSACRGVKVISRGDLPDGPIYMAKDDIL